MDYEGDAFFYTFASAPDAVSGVSAAMAGSRQDRSDPRRYSHRHPRDRSSQVRGNGRAHGCADPELGPRRPGVVSPTTRRPRRCLPRGARRAAAQGHRAGRAALQLGEGASHRSRRLRTQTSQRRHRASWNEKRSCTRAPPTASHPPAHDCGPRPPGQDTLRARARHSRRDERFSGYPAGVFACFSRFKTPRSSYPRFADPGGARATW